MLHDEIPISNIASSGEFSFNTPKLVSGLLRLIVVKAATATSTFDFKITDSKSNIIYYKTGITDTLRDEVIIPIKDINTIAVENASVDELYAGKISIEE